MANEPKVLNVNYQTTTEKVSGGQGTSSATVSSAPKELQKSEQSQVGVDLTNVKGTATGNTEERSLKVSKDATVGSYVKDNNKAGDPGRTKRNIVNTVTVEEVKALIKKYGGGDSYTKEQIDEMLATIREGQYVKVDTTTYPTLEDFLASEGEQGTVYLYPVSNEENNYYQYIWEVSDWVSLGTTALDLSQYYTKTETDALLDEKADESELSNYALLEQGFNVINAADIVSNTLTQAQYDLFNNGKMTLIKGTFLGYSDAIYYKPVNYGTVDVGIFVGENTIVAYLIQSNKKIEIRQSSVAVMNLRSIGQINGKIIPAYPADTTKQWKLVQKVGGDLGWVEDIEFNTSGYIIQQGSTFVSVAELPAQYTGVAYQFSTTGLITTSYTNGVLQHTISQNTNTGKVLIDGQQAITSSNVLKTIKITQQEYDALETKDASTHYLIVG